MSVDGTATTDQAAQRDYAFGDVTWNGGAATAQVAQSSGGAGNLTFHGGATTSQAAQTTEGSSVLLIVGVGATDQRKQKTAARGLGPPPAPARPLRAVRGDASTLRPIITTIRSGA